MNGPYSYHRGKTKRLKGGFMKYGNNMPLSLGEKKRRSLIKEHKSFTFYVKGYDNQKREYSLENPFTGEIRAMSKKDVDELYSEQYSSGDLYDPANSRERR